MHRALNSKTSRRNVAVLVACQSHTPLAEMVRDIVNQLVQTKAGADHRIDNGNTGYEFELPSGSRDSRQR